MATVQGLANDDYLSKIVLDGNKLDARLDGSITQDGPLNRSIEQATSLSLTVEDPERVLSKGGYFSRRADLEMDDLWFRMVAMEKAGDAFTLEFEDREIAMLAAHKKVRHASRSDVTRAEFLRSLVREEPHILFSCPELHKTQPITGYSTADKQVLVDARRDRGLPDTVNIKLNGKLLTRSQISQINRYMNVAQSLGAGRIPSLAAICASIGESNIGDDPNTFKPNSAGYWGVFQGGSGQRGSAKNFPDPHDTEGMAHSFFTGGRGFQAGGAIKLAKTISDPGEIATRVEASGEPGSYYGQFLPVAEQIYKARGGVTSTSDSNTGNGLYVEQYEYSRGKPAGPDGEDTWSCGQRLADEVAWRWFCAAGVVYFISDFDLIRSRPRMTLSESSPGVDNIDWSLDDADHIPDTATITGHAARWQAPPGTVVVLDESLGEAAGAWIVTEIDRQSLSNTAVTITLSKPKGPKKEPASQVVQRTSPLKTTRDGGNNSGDTPKAADGTLKPTSHVARAYAKAKSISAKKVPYVWGGGHGPIPGLNITLPGYDCSGAVSAVLEAGGILGTGGPLNTDGLMRWGDAGEGEYITVWVINEGGGNGHTFMEFKLPGIHVFFEAHHTGTIVGFENTRATAGFSPRHWPGT